MNYTTQIVVADPAQGLVWYMLLSFLGLSFLFHGKKTVASVLSESKPGAPEITQDQEETVLSASGV